MARNKISQWNARHYQKRVKELEEERRNLYAPGNGTNVWNLNLQSELTQAVLNNTTRLGFRLRAKINGSTLELYAVK